MQTRRPAAEVVECPFCGRAGPDWRFRSYERPAGRESEFPRQFECPQCRRRFGEPWDHCPRCRRQDRPG